MGKKVFLSQCIGLQGQAVAAPSSGHCFHFWNCRWLFLCCHCVSCTLDGKVRERQGDLLLRHDPEVPHIISAHSPKQQWFQQHGSLFLSPFSLKVSNPRASTVAGTTFALVLLPPSPMFAPSTVEGRSPPHGPQREPGEREKEKDSYFHLLKYLFLYFLAALGLHRCVRLQLCFTVSSLRCLSLVAEQAQTQGLQASVLEAHEIQDPSSDPEDVAYRLSCPAAYRVLPQAD